MPSNNRRKSSDDRTKKYNIKNAKRKRKSSNRGDPRATKRVETVRGNQKNRGKKSKNKEGKFSSRHPKLMMALRIFILIFLLLCVIGAGVVAGVFFGLFGDDFEITKEELTIGSANSVIVDQSGNVIANLSGDEKRKIITLEEMAEYLPKAYVAMEDERFYQHHGVDIKRTAGAILQTLLGNSSYGGSTITQQLVKNITKDDERTGIEGIMRKVREWAKAYQVERMISKDQILELYLNILYVGGEGNLHGVELGAEYYFSKSAKDLTLAECAYMAGINSSPSRYNPFDESQDNTELIKNQTKVALNKMNELGYINSQEEYDAAIAEVDNGLNFQKGQIESTSSYSYHTEAVLDQVINQFMEERGWNQQFAENYVYSGGLTIYSTVDTNIQTLMEEEFKDDKYIVTGRATNPTTGEKLNDHSQAAMVVIDYKTGYVVGTVGGLGEKTESRGLNRATQSVRQTGSSIKPIAVVAPGLQEKVITSATAYMDQETDFGGNYVPKNQSGTYSNQSVNIRYFISRSLNVPAVKIMRELSPSKSIEYLNKMGLSHITTEQDSDLSLALGGTTNGATPLEMAGAYATIANDGVYITPTFYTKVEDSSGNTVLTAQQEQTRVISEQNAYITKQIVQEPVRSGGTATYCAISGMDVAAKTGTTDDDYDRWLCGFTPYYAGACWYGYDQNETVTYTSSGNPAGSIWDAVMTAIHTNLPNATFTRPSGIVEQTVCRTTGCLATTGCTNTYTEIFTQDNLPEQCEGHGSQTICTESNKVATQYCSQYCATRQNYYGAVLPKEQLGLWTAVNGRGSTGTRINETCTLHTEPKEEEPVANTTSPTNTTNNTTGGSGSTGNGNTTTGGGNTAGGGGSSGGGSTGDGGSSGNGGSSGDGEDPSGGNEGNTSNGGNENVVAQ